MKKIKKQSKQDKKGSVRERYIKLLKEMGISRQFLGPKAYSESPIENVLNWIENDLNKGRFIEAYALTDQYVETILKYALFDYVSLFDCLYSLETLTKRIKLKTALKALKKVKVLPCNLFEVYEDFKKTRNDLVHKSIFYPEKAKQLKNDKKVKKLPLKIIQLSDKFFFSRAEEVFKYFISTPTTKENKELFFKLWLHTLESIK